MRTIRLIGVRGDQFRLTGLLLLAVGLAGVLSACGLVEPPTSPAAGGNPRPVGSPDVVILAFSGRCSSLNLACTPPFGNHTYLEDGEHLAVLQVALAFTAHGLTVESFNASAFVNTHYSAVSGAFEAGYAEAETYLMRVQREWVADYDNPTRIVLLAHSHGTVWASLLAWNHPEMTFDYVIYLDAICSFWPADNMLNQPLVQDYFHGRGEAMPWPLEATETPCESLLVTGWSGVWDVNDVVPWNVTHALEVRSMNSLPNYTWDDDPNVRPDGGSAGLRSYYSRNETHNDVAVAGGAALSWVYTTLAVDLDRWRVARARLADRL